MSSDAQPVMDRRRGLPMRLAREIRRRARARARAGVSHAHARRRHPRCRGVLDAISQIPGEIVFVELAGAERRRQERRRRRGDRPAARAAANGRTDD